jgi:adenosylmethionine-8-amino-7-oxononanoate aminotransferase
MLELDRQLLWHPYAPATGAVAPYPVRSAEGVRLTLADGREVIDGMASWWSAIHGYRHPALDKAITDQLQQMAHVMFGGLTHESAIRLAQLLVDITPAPLQRVFFADSGSVAVEVAIKMALQYWRGRGKPKRTKLLTVLGGYHGDTFGAMSVCDPVNGMHHMFSDVLTPQIFGPNPPDGFDRPFVEDDVAALRALAEQHHHELAAVIMEPVMQGAGGMRFHSPDYVRAVRQLCDDFELLFIADEIATGFGRTGVPFACQHADVAPDICCLGKSLTGGYLSLAATLCTNEVAEGIAQSESPALMHGPTFMANPLACAVGYASVSLLMTQGFEELVAPLSKLLSEGLAPARQLPGVADVRVLGAVGVIELRDPIDIAQMQQRLVERGVWLRPFGRLLYCTPPYVIDEADVSTLTASMVEAVSAVNS